MPVPTITAQRAGSQPVIAGVGERVGRGREAELGDAVDAARFLRRRGTAVGSKSGTSHPKRTGRSEGS